MVEAQLGNARSACKTLGNSFATFDSALMFLQMFKYLLLRGIEDILLIFNDSRAAPVAEMQSVLDQANNLAKPIWNDNNKSYAVRHAECKAILSPVFTVTRFGEPSGFNSVPQGCVGDLDKIFDFNYGPSNYLLIGQAAEDAYQVQEDYARQVGNALRPIRHSYETRAVVLLGKLYGSTSIPLLCSSSISALWKVCNLPYYKRQLSLVSPTCQCACQLIDSWSSSIDGLNRSQGHQRCGV